MKYTKDELKSLILPILTSMPKGDEERAANAIVELIAENQNVPETPNE